MKKILLILILLFTAQLIKAQYSPISWAKAMLGKSGTYTNCEVNEIETDAAGNLYVGGYYLDTLVPDHTQPASYLPGTDEYGFFAKFDASGNLLWVKTISWIIVKDICLDRYGNIFITGRYNYMNTVDFDPSTNVANLTVPYTALYFAKYDNSGNYMWAKALPIAPDMGSNNANVIVVDSSSNIYIGGQYRSSLDLDPGPGAVTIYNNGSFFNCPSCPFAFYAKYDSTGTLLWGHNDPTGNSVNDIAVNNSNGDIAVASNIGRPLRYVLANGTCIDSTYSDGYQHGASSVVFDHSGNVYYAGMYSDFSGDFDWGPASVTHTSTGITDRKYFIVKYNANRIFQWVTEYEIDGTLSSWVWDFEMNFSTDGNLLVAYCGVTSGTLFNGFSKIDTNGTMIWTPTIFANGNAGTYGANIVSTGNTGSFYFSANFGYSNSVSNLDMDANATNYNISAYGAYGLLAKYGDCIGPPAMPGTISGTTAVCSTGSQTYSVPTDAGVSSYIWTLPPGWSGTSATNSITVIPAANGGTISIVATNICGTSTSNTLAITFASATASSISSTACDSYILNGLTYTSSGTYTQTLTNAQGCDSTLTLHLTINNATSNSITTSACDSYILNGQTYNASGTYIQTLVNSVGCDSLLTLNLTINTSPTVTYIQNPSLICINYAPLILNTGSPSGGTYSGAGVTGNMFDPAIAGAGTTIITYDYTDGNGCFGSASSSITVDLCTDMDENISIPEITIYPNPVTDIAYISNPNNYHFKLQLFDVAGKLIVEKQSSESSVRLDLIGLTEGVYLMKLSTDNKTILQKQIKL